MRTAFQEPPKIARQGADVVTAAHRDLQFALARQVVTEPARLMKVNARRGHDHRFTAMSFNVRALAADALVAGSRRDLVLPADEARQGVVELLRGQIRRIARKGGSPERGAVVS